MYKEYDLLHTMQYYYALKRLHRMQPMEKNHGIQYIIHCTEWYVHILHSNKNILHWIRYVKQKSWSWMYNMKYEI